MGVGFSLGAQGVLLLLLLLLVSMIVLLVPLLLLEILIVLLLRLLLQLLEVGTVLLLLLWLKIEKVLLPPVAFRYGLEVPPFLGSPIPYPDVGPFFVGQALAPFFIDEYQVVP